MKNLIRRILKEDLEYWSVSNASPNSDEYEMGIVEDVPIYKDHNLGKKMYERLRKSFPMITLFGGVNVPNKFSESPQFIELFDPMQLSAWASKVVG